MFLFNHHTTWIEQTPTICLEIYEKLKRRASIRLVHCKTQPLPCRRREKGFTAEKNQLERRLKSGMLSILIILLYGSSPRKNLFLKVYSVFVVTLQNRRH